MLKDCNSIISCFCPIGMDLGMFANMAGNHLQWHWGPVAGSPANGLGQQAAPTPAAATPVSPHSGRVPRGWASKGHCLAEASGELSQLSGPGAHSVPIK